MGEAVRTVSVTVRREQAPSHAREGETDWLYRLVERDAARGPLALTLDAGGGLLAVECEGSASLPPGWNPLREVALRGWWGTLDREGLPDRFTEGALFLVLDGDLEDPDRLLLTRKDHLHPYPSVRGRWMIPGGSLEGEETPYQGCLRELYEEVRSMPTADDLARRLQHRGRWELPFHHEGAVLRSTVDLFVARAPSPSVFDGWMATLLGPPGLAEADPLVLDRAGLYAALSEGEALFGAGHERVLRALRSGR